ncbi:Rho GTPase [Actinomortierella ambigua]|uniref:Rho GTPase n=1 Tax=Actinomortierella ambigua TaxID=1343610 RepID=A0A9P6PRT5_9FUNG|nr:Rho GTPase [Actinomortierella ambigua]
MSYSKDKDIVRRKLVIVGDGACGKTSLLSVFTLGYFPKRLRPLSYTKAHIILIGYSVDTPDSLDNVTSKWIREVQEYCPDTPVILVGMKKDLRDEAAGDTAKLSRFVNTAQADRVASEIGARNHLECSALTGDGVDDVFEAATRGALTVRPTETERGCCVIL